MSKSGINRHKSREQAFVILFEKCFTDGTIEEIFENAQLAREFEPSEFTLKLVNGVNDNIKELDDIIKKFSSSWKINRISKVSISLLRLSIFEMLYVDTVPVSVSVNEAVELAKEYAGEKDSSFVNGVLGAVARSGIIEAPREV